MEHASWPVPYCYIPAIQTKSRFSFGRIQCRGDIKSRPDQRFIVTGSTTDDNGAPGCSQSRGNRSPLSDASHRCRRITAGKEGSSRWAMAKPSLAMSSGAAWRVQVLISSSGEGATVVLARNPFSSCTNSLTAASCHAGRDRCCDA